MLGQLGRTREVPLLFTRENTKLEVSGAVIDSSLKRVPRA